MAAAEATAEAFAQKGAAGFWKMHDLVLANQGGEGQEREALERYAGEVGLDLARFKRWVLRSRLRASRPSRHGLSQLRLLGGLFLECHGGPRPYR